MAQSLIRKNYHLCYGNSWKNCTNVHITKRQAEIKTFFSSRRSFLRCPWHPTFYKAHQKPGFVTCGGNQQRQFLCTHPNVLLVTLASSVHPGGSAPSAPSVSVWWSRGDQISLLYTLCVFPSFLFYLCHFWMMEYMPVGYLFTYAN